MCVRRDTRSIGGFMSWTQGGSSHPYAAITVPCWSGTQRSIAFQIDIQTCLMSDGIWDRWRWTPPSCGHVRRPRIANVPNVCPNDNLDFSASASIPGGLRIQSVHVHPADSSSGCPCGSNPLHTASPTQSMSLLSKGVRCRHFDVF